MRILSSFLLCAALALASPMVQGAAIQVDLSKYPATNAYSGTATPAHADGLATGSVWNALSDDSSSIVDASGAAATGVTVRLGNSTVDGGAIDWTLVPLTGESISAVTGVYDNLLMRDAASFANAGKNAGAMVTGLEPGTYTVYAYVRNVDALSDQFDVRCDVVASDTTINWAALAANQVHVDDAKDDTGATIDTWTMGVNYVKFQNIVVSNSTDIVAIISNGSSTANVHKGGTLNGFQIAPVPEPATLAVLGMGGLGLFFRRRRQ